MRKKVGVVLLSLMATVSVVYALNRQLLANSVNYKSGGDVTGRIQMAPAGIANDNIGFQKGDRILTNIQNPRTSNLLSWQLILQETYTDYGCSGSSACNQPEITGFISLANESIAETYYGLTTADFNGTYANNAKSNVYINHMMPFNQSISSQDRKIFTYRNLQYIKEHVFADDIGFLNNPYLIAMNWNGAREGGSPGLNISSKDLKFDSEYWNQVSGHDGAWSRYVNYTVTATGEGSAGREGAGANNAIDITAIKSVRPCITLDLSNVVFGVSTGTNIGVANVSEYALDPDYTDIRSAEGAAMKLRLYNSTMRAQLNDLKNNNGVSKTIFPENQIMKLTVDANAGSDESGNPYTISALLFNEVGDFVYYKPLRSTLEGGSDYEFDLSGILPGKYKLAVVNEAYNDNDNAPKNSSSISNIKDIEIAEGPAIEYTPIYNGTPQIEKTYEYTVNVNRDDIVGSFTIDKGAYPITLSLKSDSRNGEQHVNDSLNFTLGKNSMMMPSSTPITVQVSTSAIDLVNESNSLKVKDYYFFIEAVDANDVKKEYPIHVLVNKTKPTLEFADAERKDIKVGDDLSLELDLMQSSFKGIKNENITYSIEGETANVINVEASPTNPLQYVLSFSSLLDETTLPTTLRLKAETTGNENYIASDPVYRDIFVYKALSKLQWTANNSVYLPSDCTMDSTIGTLLAKDGVGPFSYALAPPSTTNSNSLFNVASNPTVAGTAVDVKTKSNLTAGTYQIEFKVTDKKNETVTALTEIEVQANAQTGFVWKDFVSKEQIDSAEFEYGTINNKIFAEGGQSGQSVVYELAPQDMQPNGVTDASSYVTIDSTSGLLTFKKTGTIKVMATRPGNATYAESKIYMDLKIKQRAQNIVFNSNTVNKVQVGNKSTINATGSIVNGGGSGVGGIWYDLSDKTIATIDSTTGEVTGVAAGTTTLTAVLNKESTDSYTNSNYNLNYETKKITKHISIYTPMTLTYTDNNPKVKANANKIGDIVGSITVSNKAGAAPLTAQISTLDAQENADKLYFMEPVVNGNIVTLKLNKTIDAQAHASHNGGTFKVQVIITDENGPQTYDVVALVEEADNSVSFTNVDGNDITELTRMFDDTGNLFNLTSKSSSNSPAESVRYSAVDSTQDILQVTATGGVTVLKAGSTKVKVSVGSSNGYGEAEKEMLVTINPATQTIKFDDSTDPFKIELNGGSKSQKATGKVVLSNTSEKAGVGDITYKSLDPAIASIDENGMVSAVSVGQQISITATINDTNTSNYNANYKTESCTKKVQVFAGKDVSWEKQTPNLKANTSIANKVVGTITTQNTMGPISYTKVTGGDSDLFVLEDNGLTANVKFKEGATISASDLFAHGKNYEFTVNVKDDNGTTPCLVSITIDEAEDEITFKKNGSSITKISEIYGTNNNRFPITAVSKSGNAPVYKVIGDQSIIEIPLENVGQVTIKKAGTTTVEVSVPADKGYAAYKKSIAVEIAKGEQWIAFEDDEQTHAFVKDATFPAKAILTEISEGTVSSRLITYTSLTQAVCSIEPSDISGNVTMLTTGECTIKAKNEDNNWSEASVEKTILLYDGLGATFTQDKALQAETGTAQKTSLVGKISASGGVAPITYAVSTSTSADNADADFFKVNPISGVISLDKAITAADLNGKYVESKKAYVLHVNFTATDADKNVATAGNREVLVKGAPLTNVEIDTKGTGKISKVYVAQDGDFLVDVLNYHGTGSITYQVKQGQDQNVISISDGIVSILNANETGKEAVLLEAIIPASDGYDTKILDCEVEITQATQPFKFKKEKVDLPLESRVNLEVEGILAKDAEGNLLDWSMISKETGKLSVNNHTVISKSSEGEVVVKASVKGDRNYQVASAEMKVNITSKPAYNFEITVTEVTYGDIYDESDPLVAEIFLDNGVGEKTRTWESSNPNVASIDENGHITIVNAGEATISCTQSITGQPDVTSTAKITINKKEITVTIENASKYVGEMVPTFHAIIPSDEIIAGDTIGQPVFTCKDGSSPVNADTKAGSYDITGLYPASEYPNYILKTTPAKMTIEQDTSSASWYHLEGATSGSLLESSSWYNEDVKIVLDFAVGSAGTYDEISLDKIVWDKTGIVSDNEGEHSKEIHFRLNENSVTHPLALASSQTSMIRIDKTKPKVKSITGTQTNKDSVSKLINDLTFGTFFKPGTKVSIQSEDILPLQTDKMSGIKETSYSVYEIDRETGEIGTTPIDTGTLHPDATGKSEVSLDKIGLYRVCATTTDHAGNISAESCSDLNIIKINVDIDDDGEDEYQDPGNDGCADINIPLLDKEGNIHKINVDRDGDHVPDLNIDSNGDGIADINIDTDEDKKPDVNLLILDTWTPTSCVSDQLDNEGMPTEYCTMKGLTASINVDTKKDNIPDINIDTDGDMKAEINIALKGDIPTLNLLLDKKIVWEPNKNFIKDAFSYDTMDTLTPQLDIDYNEDGYPDVNIDTNKDGLPDLNINIDGDLKPETNIDGDGDGLPDINVDGNGDGVIEGTITPITEWKPDSIHTINGKEFGTMLISDEKKDVLEDNGVQVERPGGSFLPNYSIRVNSVLDRISDEMRSEIEIFLDDNTEIKEILDVQLFDGERQVQPDGKYKIKIPMKDDWKLLKKLKVVGEQADGSFKEVDATITEDFITFESDFLGKVGIIGEKVKNEEPEDKPDVKIPDLSGSGGSTPNTNVKGNYTTGGIGGAGTGDSSNTLLYLSSILLATSVLYALSRKRNE